MNANAPSQPLESAPNQQAWKAMTDKEQTKPFAHAVSPSQSPTIYPLDATHDEEAARGWRAAQYLRKRRCLLCCCGCCGATVVVLGVVILVLALTVFKVKDPTLTMNSIHLDSFNVGPRDLEDQALVSANATLTADVSLKNPNIAAFKFDNSTTEFYYEGVTVGVAYAPEGRIGSHSTARMNVTVDVLMDRVAASKVNGNFVTGTSLNLTSYTEINGRVNVWGIYKRNIDIMLNCSMTVDASIIQQDVKNKNCQASVK